LRTDVAPRLQSQHPNRPRSRLLNQLQFYRHSQRPNRLLNQLQFYRQSQRPNRHLNQLRFYRHSQRPNRLLNQLLNQLQFYRNSLLLSRLLSLRPQQQFLNANPSVKSVVEVVSAAVASAKREKDGGENAVPKMEGYTTN
jgi:hypothetical protein